MVATMTSASRLIVADWCEERGHQYAAAVFRLGDGKLWLPAPVVDRTQIPGMAQAIRELSAVVVHCPVLNDTDRDTLIAKIEKLRRAAFFR